MAFSFANIPGGRLPGPFESAPMLDLREAVLAGFPNPIPVVADRSEVQWDLAKAWDQELVRAGAARPHTIPRFEEIADVYWLQDKIMPFELDSPIMRKRKTAEKLKAARKETESLIVRFLERTATPSDGQ